ncbi:uncharacterized protein LOC127756319 [Oryza glaberrima]|uniref:uncharacterized protein LOC127756319 n=1 Tax=Oryza glaberrima TaxID=4538 RepID=UPI00224C36B8|nr:uncharacterized protein LOC127756319 [Oryza glaberrima]
MVASCGSDGTGGQGNGGGSWTRNRGNATAPDARIGVGDATDLPQGAAVPRSPPACQGLGNIEDVWNHSTKLAGQGFRCGYCRFTNKGGGATRLREHLGGITGEVRSCNTVPPNMRHAMREGRQLSRKRKREREHKKLCLERELMQGLNGGEEVIDLGSDEEGQVQMAIRNSLRDKNLSRAIERRRGSGSSVRVSLGKKSITAYFDKDLARSKVSLQPRIDTVLLEGSREKLGQAWAKWFHANDIAGLKADCPYFCAAMKLTQQLGATAQIPTANGIDGEYLQANFEEAEHSLEQFKQDWKQYGVTVMCDSWTGPTGMAIINFMVYCNARMFFHKSIDVSAHKQSADFIYEEIRKVVVEEIGPQLVVQIVTDNGSNYKKACERLVAQYKHIFWQPCAAHTINLMLKDIAKFQRVNNVVASAKLICRFFYNHNRLHDEMKRMIDGELIRPNATRFGTVFMFLQSFLDKKDKLRKWMVSKDWKESDWTDDESYDYTEACLTSSTWWSALEWVVGAVKPLYLVLRYADTQKNCTLPSFKTRMMAAIHAMEAQLGGGSRQFQAFMSKVTKRVCKMETNTLMVVAAVLDPDTHYKYNSSKNPVYALALTDALEKMAETPDDAVQVLGGSNLEEKFLPYKIFDEENPIWDWLDKSTDEVGPSLIGMYQSFERDFATGGNRKGRRARVDVEGEEIEFEESEAGDEEDEFDDASSGGEDDNNHDDGIDELTANNDDNCDEHIGTSTWVDQDELVRTSTRVDQDIEASAGSGRLKRKKRRIQSLYMRE